MKTAVNAPPLSPLGTARQQLEAAEAYPARVRELLREADLDDERAYLAWQLCQLDPQLPSALRDELLLVVTRLLAALAQGSTRLPVDAAERSLLARATALVGTPGQRKPLILEGEHLYQQRVLAFEERVVAAVKARAARPGDFPAPAVKAAMDALLAGSNPRLSEEQADAIRTALGRSLTVVSGGPGTGKTTIALHIARGLVRLGLPPASLALAAPTGKAANRLEEAFRAGLAALVDPAASRTAALAEPAASRTGAAAVDPAASRTAALAELAAEDRALLACAPTGQTLHRLLGWSRGGFIHHENNRLAARALIVDEGSMIDLVLMDRLLRSLRDDAVLVLLGDADQLPSVEAGAVFRDLTPGPLAVRLRRGFRMDHATPGGGRIAAAATALREGRTGELASLVDERASAATATFAGVEVVPPAERETLLTRWHDERIGGHPEWQELCEHEYELTPAGFAAADCERLARLHAHLQQGRILCVTRERPGGVDHANALLHARHAGSHDLAPGEPVMIVRNDYERGLWNGDQGMVLRVRQPGRPPHLMAVFRLASAAGARWAAFAPHALAESLQLAFALTVHKAQGSEHDAVLLLLPDRPIPLCSRELVYTALTRARHAVTICGTLPVLAAAAANTLSRSSGIAEKLAG